MIPEDRPRRRRLSDEERALWGNITRSVLPLHRKPRDVESAETTEPKSKGRKTRSPSPPRPAAVRHRAAGAPKELAPAALAPFGRRLKQKLARGTEAIDRRLDLHGLTQQEAHQAVARFLRLAQAAGAKTVLVVTGKGDRAEARDLFAERGVLRQRVPQWLRQAEFRDVVLGFETAHVGHGGEGALYVRLRRPR
jgi:DNA-nicking Smr family endonuclease